MAKSDHVCLAIITTSGQSHQLAYYSIGNSHSVNKSTMNHHVASSDFLFAMKPPTLSSTSDETSSAEPSPSSGEPSQPAANTSESASSRPRGQQIRSFGKKLGGAISKMNVAKWIEDLESDQELADHLDRINSDTADEQERKMIKRQAMEACMQAMEEHLLDFLAEHPQATYEEWICNLHPDNINLQLAGLTNTPMIDHRFYVADSDHRLLWNEHLNDLNDKTNMAPVRHFVAARTFAKKPSNVVEETKNTEETPRDVEDTPQTSNEANQEVVGDLLSF